MFEALTERLQGVFRGLRSKGRLHEADVDQALREVRLALLEADVNFRVARTFTNRVREQALAADVLDSLTPAQQVLQIVNEALVEVLGGESVPLDLSGTPPTPLMLVGLQGAGKTTCRRQARLDAAAFRAAALSGRRRCVSSRRRRTATLPRPASGNPRL